MVPPSLFDCRQASIRKDLILLKESGFRYFFKLLLLGISILQNYFSFPLSIEDSLDLTNLLVHLAEHLLFVRQRGVVERGLFLVEVGHVSN